MIKSIRNDVQSRLESIIETTKQFEQTWKRAIKPMYFEYQKERWETENWGEWRPLNERYKDFKIKMRQQSFLANANGFSPITFRNRLKFKGKQTGRKTRGTAYDPDCEKMMIMTGLLKGSVLGTNKEYKEVTGSTNVKIYSTVPYFTHADKRRTVSKFRKTFSDKCKKVLLESTRK